MSNLGTVLAEAEEHYRYAVKAETFGHLYPKLGSKQNGWVTWYVSAFGDVGILDFEFEGLESSEPLCCDIMDFIGDIQDDLELEPGLYRWQGWYKKFKNCRCQFQVATIEKAEFP